MHWVSISPLGSKEVYHHIRGSVTDKDNNYLLEIANTCAADSELLALCALAPEIREFLEMFNSPLAEMLLAKWTSMTMELWRAQNQASKPAEDPAHPWTDTGN